jgi:hypothetical protein
MKRLNPEPPENDVTLAMLDSVLDGSLAGLANHHLLKLQLQRIRDLPEAFERDRARVGRPESGS